MSQDIYIYVFYFEKYYFDSSLFQFKYNFIIINQNKLYYNDICRYIQLKTYYSRKIVKNIEQLKHCI